jgi:hypothetical protein
VTGVSAGGIHPHTNLILRAPIVCGLPGVGEAIACDWAHSRRWN